MTEDWCAAIERGKQMNRDIVPCTDLKQIQKRYGSELEDLARFICGAEDGQASKSVALEEDIITRAARLSPPFQGQFLRRELLRLIINLRRDEVSDLLRPYENREKAAHCHCAPLDDAARKPLEHLGNRLSLLHRLVLVMIDREGYTVSTCGTMLGCRDHIVGKVYDDGLTCLSMEGDDTGESRREGDTSFL